MILVHGIRLLKGGWVKKEVVSRKTLEWAAIEGESPVGENNLSQLLYFLSTPRNDSLGGSCLDQQARLNTPPHR